MRLYAPHDLDVVVVSYGGAGTTMLLDFLNKSLCCNDPNDLDSLKHSPIPPFCFKSSLKVIYVVGDPIEAIASLFRRDFQWRAFDKFTCFSGRHRTNPPLVDIQNYAAAGVDILMLQRHFENYMCKYQIYETFVIHYETMWESMPQLLTFLGLPAEQIEHFPARQQRLSSLGPGLRNRMTPTYGQLLELIDQFPSGTILHKRTGRYLMHFLRVIPLILCCSLRSFYKRLFSLGHLILPLKSQTDNR